MKLIPRLGKILPFLFRRRAKTVGAVDLASLEKLIGHRFKDPLLLQVALTHPSYSSSQNAKPSASTSQPARAGRLARNPAPGAAARAEAKAEVPVAKAAARVKKHAKTAAKDNQRLEFLGDAVLSLVLAEALYQATDADEGLLTDARTRVSCGKHLARVGRELGLGALLRVARNGDTARIRESDTANEDALEALFGAVFLDRGLNAARKLARRLFAEELQFDAARVEQGRSAKNRLQEWVQSDGRPNDGRRIEYRCAERSLDYPQRFTVEVLVDGVQRGSGEGPTKRAASEFAAAAALAVMRPKAPSSV
ncbi:MAG: hypothetical protein LBG65_03890 [Puniceicoccales bacterium]|jgi:ribonuclease-3|nr:hypothetical protein [Puniceicoccales bacterium]